MGVRLRMKNMCRALGWALVYGEAYDTARLIGLVSELLGLLLARAGIEGSWVNWCSGK